MTFAALAELEPRLIILASDIRHAAHARTRSAAAVWYEAGGFKERLLRLVGWKRQAVAPHPDPDKERLLWSPEAYDAAYRHLYALLLG